MKKSKESGKVIMPRKETLDAHCQWYRQKVDNIMNAIDSEDEWMHVTKREERKGNKKKMMLKYKRYQHPFTIIVSLFLQQYLSILLHFGPASPWSGLSSSCYTGSHCIRHYVWTYCIILGRQQFCSLWVIWHFVQSRWSYACCWHWISNG